MHQLDFHEFCAVEAVAHRALRAAQSFASGKDAEHLESVAFIMSELVHAALILHSKESTDIQRLDVVGRLFGRLFADPIPIITFAK